LVSAAEKICPSEDQILTHLRCYGYI